MWAAPAVAVESFRVSRKTAKTGRRSRMSGLIEAINRHQHLGSRCCNDFRLWRKLQVRQGCYLTYIVFSQQMKRTEHLIIIKLKALGCL